MSEDTHRKLVAFLSGEFARIEGRQCVLFELVTAQPGQRGDSLRTWDRKEQPEIFEGLGNIESIATEIIHLAEDHAETFGGGLHRFEVRTEQHLGKRQKCAFRVLVDGDLEQAGGGADSPNQTGLVGQLMRHLEIKERVQTQMIQHTIGTMSRMVSDLADENRDLRQSKISDSNELEAARSRQAERDLDGLRQINADKRKDAAFEKISLLPVMASRMLGDGAAPGAPTPVSILASELADSLAPDQFVKIASALSQGQQVLLAELIRAAKNVSEKKPDQAAQAAG